MVTPRQLSAALVRARGVLAVLDRADPTGGTAHSLRLAVAYASRDLAEGGQTAMASALDNLEWELS